MDEALQVLAYHNQSNLIDSLETETSAGLLFKPYSRGYISDPNKIKFIF